jgi:4,4'-diaponeurosporenoate glycosyltransferase
MTDLVFVVALLIAGAGAWWLLADLRTLPSGGGHRPATASVSVVIPARNEESTLPALLESLRQLTVEIRQVVVVDDDSRDATAPVAV